MTCPPKMSNFSEACNIYLKFSHANRKRNHRQIELWVKYEETVIYGCFKVKLQWNLSGRPRNNNSTTDPGQKSLGMMQHSQLSVISGCPHKTVLPFYLLFFLLRPPPPPTPLPTFTRPTLLVGWGSGYSCAIKKNTNKCKFVPRLFHDCSWIF